MDKYKIIKNKGDELVIQVLNKCDILEVQNEFIENGYIVENTYIGSNIYVRFKKVGYPIQDAKMARMIKQKINDTEIHRTELVIRLGFDTVEEYNKFEDWLKE